MNDFYYTLIQEYPGSPKLGTIVTSKDNDYYKHTPYNYPSLWKKNKIGDVVCKSVDGVDLKEGDIAYYQTNSNMIYSTHVTTFHFNSTHLWASLEKLEQDLIQKINLNIENEIIKGEDIRLYGVLTTGGWELDEISSKDLFYRYKRSEKWKWFRTKEEREEYIFRYKPRFSFKDVVDIHSKLSLGGEEELINIVKRNYKTTSKTSSE